MKKGEKIIDKIIGTILFVAVGGAFLSAMLMMASDNNKEEAVIKKDSTFVPVDCKFTCVHCGWENSMTLFEFPDTTKVHKKP